jgi:hypothetical protein
MSIEDKITTAGLQDAGGSHQTITEAGLEAWINNVRGFRAANAGKKRLFSASRVEIISTSRRAVD